MRISLSPHSLRALCLLPALALGACDPKLKIGEILEGDTGTDGTSTGDDAPADSAGDATTSGPTSNDTTTDSSTTSGGDSTGGDDGPDSAGSSGDPPADDTGSPIIECDLWLQDCPFGEKCTPWADGSDAWNATRCVPIDPMPRPPGSPCEFTGEVLDGVDNCDIGSVCWGVDPDIGSGTCVSQCIGSPDQPMCADDFVCIVSNEGVLTLCLPECDPLLQDCAGNDVCIDNGQGFVCIFDGSDAPGGAFEPCEFANQCDKGLACVPSSLAAECDPASAQCCLPFCDLDAANDCPGAGQECVSWYGDGVPPAGQENVGLCMLPG